MKNPFKRSTQQDAEQQALIQRRHAHLDCRAVWAVLSNRPDWMKDVPQCLIMAQTAKVIQKSGTEAALRNSMRWIFEAAFEQIEATAWLPVVLMQSVSFEQRWLEQAWQRASESQQLEGSPLPHCMLLSDTQEGNPFDRLNALFEADPLLPAVLLLGLDSPISSRDASPPAGHAAVALLLSRPNLAEPAPVEPAPPQTSQPNYLMPFWEREERAAYVNPWGIVPLHLQPDLYDTPPLATLHRLHTAPASHRGLALARTLQSLIGESLEDAAMMPIGGKVGAPPEPLDLGWIAHNAGGSSAVAPTRVAAIGSALIGFECETDMFNEAGDLLTEHGEIGAARRALLWAEAVIRAAQLQMPALTVEFDNEGNVTTGLVRPATAA